MFGDTSLCERSGWGFCCMKAIGREIEGGVLYQGFCIWEDVATEVYTVRPYLGYLGMIDIGRAVLQLLDSAVCMMILPRILERFLEYVCTAGRVRLSEETGNDWSRPLCILSYC